MQAISKWSFLLGNVCTRKRVPSTALPNIPAHWVTHLLTITERSSLGRITNDVDGLFVLNIRLGQSHHTAGTMKVFAVSMLVLYLCLGALAAYFGFAARDASNTIEYHVLLVKEICIYPDSPAQTTGLLAGLILLVAQMLVIATCACTCRWNNKKQVEGLNAAMVGLGCVLGCFACGLSAAFFASGSALSRPAERYRARHRSNTSADCAQPKFTVAIAMMFVAILLGVVFFTGIIQEARRGVLTTPHPQQIAPVADPEPGPENRPCNPEPSPPPPVPGRLPV